ncbi:activating transcription factor 7-interacting protein 1 [Pectinophora gossypiella]|uniref:Activating transcription factor 7-interacting protein Fn3 domain-containing protein n=1 Tax=Pectinophora gossypiella TaxID=13191 RepID=A0A1E1W4W2_PECGO|nr:activating transcription factor 7-interacting protein 1 [Pectinophora gossypiella]XP_049874154.1 activating transcription factor 7-interacting protein 1 [Pectinophora gossypiella]
MQLILETESPSVNIQEKMSTLDEDTFNERPIANGLKDLVEELNGVTESNGDKENGDKENVKSKDNIVSSTDGVKDNIDKITEVKANVENDTMSEKSEDQTAPKLDVVNEISTTSPCKENSEGDASRDKEQCAIVEQVIQIKTNVDKDVSKKKSEDQTTQKQNVVEEMSATHTRKEKSSEGDASSDEQCKEPIESQSDTVLTKNNIEHEEQSVTNKAQNSDVENFEAMDIDESDTSGFVAEELGNLENKVTQSISAVVDEIVKGLDEENLCNDGEIENLEQDAEKEQLVNSESNANLSEDIHDGKENSSDMDQPMEDAPLQKQTVPSESGFSTTEAPCPIPDEIENSIVTSEIVEEPQKPTHNGESVDNILDDNITQNSTDNDVPVDVPEIENFKVDTSKDVNIESVTDKNDVEDKLDNQDIKLGSPCTDTTDSKVESLENEHTNDNSIIKSEEKSLVEVKKSDVSEVIATQKPPNPAVVENKGEVLDVEVIKECEYSILKTELEKDINIPKKQITEKVNTPVIKLSNTLDILSDDEDEHPKKDSESKPATPIVTTSDDKCINLDDDDDIMLIDEETTTKENEKQSSDVKVTVERVEDDMKTDTNIVDLENSIDNESKDPVTETKTENGSENVISEEEHPTHVEKTIEVVSEKQEKPKPLVPDDFFKTYRKNLAEMTRDDLEEFCILKIVESIIDRSSLNEIRTKLKTMAQNIEEYKKKAMMLTKQNRDLQVVLKSVQEEQRKMTDQPIAPLKITRSVGMQVLMTAKNQRRLVPGPPSANNTNANNQSNTVSNALKRNSTPRGQKQTNNQQIPVPRLVPAVNTAANKTSNSVSQGANNIMKINPAQNGLKVPSPVTKAPEKRTHNRMQTQSQSVTVDLTDDEPPAKVVSKSSPAPPVRLVSPSNLLAPRQTTPTYNSPRKVYIPISGPQGQTIQSVRPGQTIMLKTVSSQGPRGRGPAAPIVRMQQNSMQVKRVPNTRHPAPLPDAMKQYQPPNWKSLPPAPDLKLSKVENGIVISWKIEGYQEDSYEEIASYQLYAYQETSAPPSTALWKKIGDVKALPLPMACTLTQFMAGYKYYFAVRAVDIRSRLGPFSLPGSILLVNKM